MKPLYFLFLGILILMIGCEDFESMLPDAKNYTVVGSHKLELMEKDRSGKIWFVTAAEANNYETYAQTSILAAYEISRGNRDIDLVLVILVPGEEFVASSISYAQTSYARDKKGAKGLSGVDLSAVTFSKWFVRAAEHPLSEKEFAIASLWVSHQKDFPSQDMLSSLSYDRDALRMFIADSLQLDIEEVIFPGIPLRDYDKLEFIE